MPEYIFHSHKIGSKYNMGLISYIVLSFLYVFFKDLLSTRLWVFMKYTLCVFIDLSWMFVS